MITKGKKEYIPYLKNIWKECFGDSDKYIDFFFENRYKDDNVVIKICDDIPVAMLFVLEADIIVNDKAEKYGYIYAVSTLKAYRGRGISTELINYANSNFGLKGTFLVPASESLFNFYKYRDYKEAFSLKEVLFETYENKVDMYVIDEISADKYTELRDNMFLQEGYVKWGCEAIKYALEENVFIGGKNYYIEYNGNVYAVMGYSEKGRFFAREAVISDKDFYDVLNFIAVKEKCNEVYTRIDVKRNIEGKNIDFGLINCNENIEDGYFNIALD